MAELERDSKLRRGMYVGVGDPMELVDGEGVFRTGGSGADRGRRWSEFTGAGDSCGHDACDCFISWS